MNKKQTIRLNESQLRRIVKESVKRVLRENDSDFSDETWHVQETIGGWKQNPMFSGSYDECLRYLENTHVNGSVALIPDSELKIDYLDDYND